MIQASALIALFQRALDERWGYIWGAKGQTWTKAKQEAATRAQTVKYGAKWIGQRVADCSGLFAWAFKELGGSIYHGSNTIWRSHLAAKGTLKNGTRLDGLPLKPGTAMFLTKTENGVTNRHHIGLYIGNDTVIEAKGTAYGVVTSRSDHWHEWGELKGVEYEENGEKTEEKTGMETVRTGSKGESVSRLQACLTGIGYDCGTIDGVFGARTLGAVTAYQRTKGLKTDGIVGPDTWRALLADTETVDGPDVPEDFSTSVVARAEFDALLTRVNALEEALNIR